LKAGYVDANAAADYNQSLLQGTAVDTKHVTD